MHSSVRCYLFHLLRPGMVSLMAPAVFSASMFCAAFCAAQAAAQKPAAAPAPAPSPDTLMLSNGDVLHGKLVSAVDGKVTFHTDSLGDVAVTWDKIKELHTGEKFAVLDKSVKPRGKKDAGQIPQGTLDVVGQAITVHSENGAAAPNGAGTNGAGTNGTALAPIPVKNAEYVMDGAEIDKELYHEPGFFTGWNGPVTFGATVVTATQDQFTASGTIGLVRAVPSASWLTPRNRTTADFSGSFGKITEPGTPTIKTAIYHAAAERDEYLSSRIFAMAQTAFDHNFGQGLALQSAFGGGFGLTAFKNPKQELDLKANIQYETQQFIATPGAASSPSQNLIGSTISAGYMAKLKLLTLTQSLAFVPAFNVPRDYSANETDTLAFPAYKNLSFSIGTLDSYLNDPPLTTTPPTKPNSFQFTVGLTYAIKSKY